MPSGLKVCTKQRALVSIVTIDSLSFGTVCRFSGCTFNIRPLLQQHLSDQQYYCLLRCDLVYRFVDMWNKNEALTRAVSHKIIGSFIGSFFTCKPGIHSQSKIAKFIVNLFSKPIFTNMEMPYRTKSHVIKWKHFPRYWPFVRGISRWIPHTKASDAELWYFLWSASE